MPTMARTTWSATPIVAARPRAASVIAAPMCGSVPVTRWQSITMSTGAWPTAMLPITALCLSLSAWRIDMGRVLAWALLLLLVGPACADNEVGEKTFKERCVVCHQEDAHGAAGVAPSLVGTLARHLN